MPHDSHGRALKAGDQVTLRAVVVNVYPDPKTNDTCNVELQVIGQASYQPVVNCSAGLATRVDQ